MLYFVDDIDAFLLEKRVKLIVAETIRRALSVKKQERLNDLIDGAAERLIETFRELG